MPARKKTWNRKRKATKRYQRKRGKRYQRKSRRLNQTIGGTLISGVPSTRLVKMRYVATVLLTSTGGLSSQYCFRWNSIYDPDFTSTGAQPIGYTQWSNMYKNYTVVGAKLQSDWAFTNSDGVPVNYGIFNQTTTTALSANPDFLDSQGMGKIYLVNPYVNGSGSNRHVKSFFSARKWFNIKDVKDNQMNIGAPFGSNPPATGDAYCFLYMKPNAAGTTSAYVKCTFTYLVLLSDPIPLTL